MDYACVRDIMPDTMVTVSEGDRLSTVEDIMRLGRVRHMPVVRAGTLVGVVLEWDLLRASLSSQIDVKADMHRAFLHGVEIAKVMSAPAIVIDPAASVKQAARKMADGKIGCLPVVDGDVLIGLITETDVLRYFAHHV